MKFTLESPDGLRVFDAIGFSLGERFSSIVEGDRLDIAFTLEENVWNGRSSIQLKLIDIYRKGE
jgi:single-stranded-DNA-specific exonuclease